nr:MAG TPA: hypothetical protein [Caudoviricetes sp.]
MIIYINILTINNFSSSFSCSLSFNASKVI